MNWSRELSREGLLLLLRIKEARAKVLKRNARMASSRVGEYTGR